jgi:hypothetical protein
VGVSVGARIEPDGRFEFVNVPPGQYVIQVSRGRQNPSTEGDFAAVPVDIADADVRDLVVRAEAPSTIAGRITFDSTDRGKLPSQGSIEIIPVPVDPLLAPLNNLATAAIHSDWSFDLGGITGTRRLQVIRVPPGWALEAVSVDGVDVTDRPMVFGGSSRSLRDVEVVLTDRVSTLTGAVTDDRSRSVPGAGVIVFSTDPANWYTGSRFIRRTAADASSAFTVKGLPSGSYHVAALSSLPADGPDAWQDPTYLEALGARASIVAITEGLPATTRIQLMSRQ